MAINERLIDTAGNGGGYITDNLELYYDITDTSSYNSGTTITDLSGQGNDGTILGGLNSASTSGGVRFLTFDGSDDYINTNGNIVDISANDFTAEFWINYNITTGEQGAIFGVEQDGTQTRQNWSRLDLRSGENRYNYFAWGTIANGLYSSTGSGDDHLSEWVHVTHTLKLSSKTRRIYINGTELTNNSGSGTASSITSDLYIMAYNYRNVVASLHMDGALSKVRIYSSELSSDDINVNFDAEKAYYGL